MPDPPMYELEFYAEESGGMPALRWIKEDLSPTKRRALGMAMNEVLQRHGVQVVGERSWGRQLGEGEIELARSRLTAWRATQAAQAKRRRGDSGRVLKPLSRRKR